MPEISSYAVFCGSASGFEPHYKKIAHEAGTAIAAAGACLIYGGAAIGLMGAVADGALAAGGRVKGVLPAFLQTKEIAHAGLSELIVVENMHERKMVMHELSDAIIALPGGWGTMEELMEMLTWAQLGLHSKPIGLLNIGGFYDGLIQLAATMERNGFLKPEHTALLIIKDDIQGLLAALNAYEAPRVKKWLAQVTAT